MSEIDIQNSTEDIQQADDGRQDESARESNDLSYEKGVSLSDKMKDNPGATLEQVLELDKLEKFKWNGKVLTPKDLKSMAMMQSDYTKKTQELSSERKYWDNLNFDLKNVKNNPALVEEFKKEYPEKFHGFLDFVARQDSQQASADVSHETKPQEPTQVNDPRLEEVYKHYQEQKLELAKSKIDSLFDKMGSKYPDADEEKVLARAQLMYEMHKKDPHNHLRPDDKKIEELFKMEHEGFNKKLSERQSKLLNEQKKANDLGKGPGAGGGIPGQAPRMAKTIKEATEMFRSDHGM